MVSRFKVEHITSLTINGVNILLYLAIITAVVFKCINGDFSNVVLSIYGSVIAGLLIMNEIREIKFSIHYFLFLSTHRGRGFMMIFFGCLVLSNTIINIVIGTIVLAVGFLYIVLSFLSHFPQPHPITINWRNWNDFSAEGLDLPRPVLQHQHQYPYQMNSTGLEIKNYNEY